MLRGYFIGIRGAAATLFVVIALACTAKSFAADPARLEVHSPNRRNVIALQLDRKNGTRYSVSRDGKPIVGSSPFGPRLIDAGNLCDNSRGGGISHGGAGSDIDFLFGKASPVSGLYHFQIVAFKNDKNLQWQAEFRAYDDGVAFRYMLPNQDVLPEARIQDEATEFHVVGDPTIMFNVLEGFTTSHESLYEQKPLSQMPPGKLCDMPVLLTWPKGPAAAITEARVRDFAGMYLERSGNDATVLRCRLSPSLKDQQASVKAKTPLRSPWRVVMLADKAGQLLESNLLLSLNAEPTRMDTLSHAPQFAADNLTPIVDDSDDPVSNNFDWAKPGKTTFPWWNGEFEEDYKLKGDKNQFVERNFAYIDFCARNKIAYHGVHGNGLSWYHQSSTDYGAPSADADVRVPRPEIELPKILEYAKERGVGIRLWVHWKPLSEHLEEAFTLYEQWGVKGLMVDFLDRDDQEMIDWTEKMLESAARHHLHIQIHGSSKFSGEQLTYPHLFNRECVLNLEVDKWSKDCTPDHNVNVAYTRGLAGPVDYHLGGFRSVSRAAFEPHGLKPNVMGTRCHNLALYVVYENPMPMVADVPSAYEGQPGFDFLTEVPTTWDETRFLQGEPGEYIVIARRKGNTWYLGGITNWTAREIALPLKFLGAGMFDAKLSMDGSLDESKPTEVQEKRETVDATKAIRVSMASGGGFVAVIANDSSGREPGDR